MIVWMEWWCSLEDPVIVQEAKVLQDFGPEKGGVCLEACKYLSQLCIWSNKKYHKITFLSLLILLSYD